MLRRPPFEHPPTARKGTHTRAPLHARVSVAVRASRVPLRPPSLVQSHILEIVQRAPKQPKGQQLQGLHGPISLATRGVAAAALVTPRGGGGGQSTRCAEMYSKGGRGGLKGGEGVGWDPPPSSQGPPMVPAKHFEA